MSADDIFITKPRFIFFITFVLMYLSSCMENLKKNVKKWRKCCSKWKKKYYEAEKSLKIKKRNVKIWREIKTNVGLHRSKLWQHLFIYLLPDDNKTFSSLLLCPKQEPRIKLDSRWCPKLISSLGNFKPNYRHNFLFQ